jgi:hypothetical protein
MSNYKREIYEYLAEANTDDFKVFKDEQGEISILTTKKDNLLMQSESVQQAIMLASPEFESKPERVEIAIGDGRQVLKIVINPNKDDLENNRLTVF